VEKFKISGAHRFLENGDNRLILKWVYHNSTKRDLFLSEVKICLIWHKKRDS
jgi:hypothetical protein